MSHIGFRQHSCIKGFVENTWKGRFHDYISTRLRSGQIWSKVGIDWHLSVKASNKKLIKVRILTFICPCIASISLKYNQQDKTFSRCIYFYKSLCMFQAVPPPIIRSTKLYIQRQVLLNQYCLQFCAPDDGRRNRLKHAARFIEINRSRKRCILLVVI